MAKVIKSVSVLEVPNPVFYVDEKMVSLTDNLKIGQRVRAILNYKVSEQTKSYYVLRLKSISLTNVKRII